MHPTLTRTVVVGTSCCGKTTLARRLAERLGAPHVELDALHWDPGWVARPLPEFRRLVAVATAGPSWVVDGNYGKVRDLVWPRATAVVWLNYGLGTVLGRAIRRTVRRSITRETLYSGNRESFRRSLLDRESILWWVVGTYFRRRRQYRALQRSGAFPGLVWVELGRPRELERFLESLEVAA